MSRLALPFVAFSLFAASTAVPALPAAAADGASPIAACLSEAQWPVTHSPAFMDGSPRTREMLLNGSDAAVMRYSGLCRLIATAPTPDRAQANAQCQQDATDDKSTAGDPARAHLARMAARCAALAG